MNIPKISKTGKQFTIYILHKLVKCISVPWNMNVS